ncbi:hypothetical protein VPHSUH08_04105 [Veillonella sp. S13054-11]|uniref:hypothetical protein n=1 Tax=Veillonella sp. S13054-11 TaxID=2027458 RepID=UPI000CF4325C|nr:hypothetical protein [Veillonella sp. S13054-11]PQL13962.1 hypothetical protein VPHSUH08_04105 [Veillonella sp. S13054-11]
MNKNVKIVEFANFNITFGDTNEPLLSQLDYIVIPALRSELKRGKSYPSFYFINVRLIDYKDELILQADYIKDTKYEAKTRMDNGVLKVVDDTMLAAPYSKIIVFLRNHRMILIKNEPSSPDIRGLSSTLEYILSEYINTVNEIKRKSGEEEFLPYANVNIVGIPLQAKGIHDMLHGMKKITLAKFKLFPLNNDIDPSAFTKYTREMMLKAESNTGNINFNSPQNKLELAKIIESTKGLAEVRVEGADEIGNKLKISEHELTKKEQFPFEGDLNQCPSDTILEYAFASGILEDVSEDNNKCYLDYRRNRNE